MLLPKDLLKDLEKGNRVKEVIRAKPKNETSFASIPRQFADLLAYRQAEEAMRMTTTQAQMQALMQAPF